MAAFIDDNRHKYNKAVSTVVLQHMLYCDLPDAWQSMKIEFPDDERKPLEMLQRQYRQGIYDTWWLTEHGERRGYAMLLRAEGCRLVLLDYLAMLDKGKGYGTACLEALKRQYPDGILVEAEAMETGLEPDVAVQRERRLRFYRKAGFAPCAFRTNVFGVAYQIHLWTKEPPKDRERLAAGEYYRLYQTQVPQQWLEQHFYVEGQPER